MRKQDDGYTAQTEAFLDTLRRHRDPSADPRAFPDLIATLGWTNDDNGEALELVRCRWLREGDLERTELAFAMDYVYPDRSRAQVSANVMAAAEAQAEIHAVCDAWAAGPDEWRAAIAAWMELPAPGRTATELTSCRAEVIARFPRAAKADYRW